MQVDRRCLEARFDVERLVYPGSITPRFIVQTCRARGPQRRRVRVLRAPSTGSCPRWSPGPCAGGSSWCRAATTTPTCPSVATGWRRGIGVAAPTARPAVRRGPAGQPPGRVGVPRPRPLCRPPHLAELPGRRSRRLGRCRGRPRSRCRRDPRLHRRGGLEPEGRRPVRRGGTGRPGPTVRAGRSHHARHRGDDRPHRTSEPRTARAPRSRRAATAVLVGRCLRAALVARDLRPGRGRGHAGRMPAGDRAVARAGRGRGPLGGHGRRRRGRCHRHRSRRGPGSHGRSDPHAGRHLAALLDQRAEQRLADAVLDTLT